MARHGNGSPWSPTPSIKQQWCHAEVWVHPSDHVNLTLPEHYDRVVVAGKTSDVATISTQVDEVLIGELSRSPRH